MQKIKFPSVPARCAWAVYYKGTFVAFFLDKEPANFFIELMERILDDAGSFQLHEL